jgi:predicted PurR-regulated permease PerM
MSSSMPFIQRLSYALGSISLIIVALYLGQHILIPLAFASLFSLMLIGPCSFFEKYNMSRGMAAFTAVILFLLAGAIILYAVSSQIVRFRNDLPLMADQLKKGFIALQLWVQHTLHVSTKNINDFWNTISAKTVSDSASLIGSTVTTVSSTLIFLVLIPVYMFLLLLYRGLIANFLLSAFPEKNAARVSEVLQNTRRVTKGYVLGLIIEMIIVAAMNCIGFFILGVKYALLLAIIAALFNLVPYLGIFIACVLSVLITFSTNSPGTAAGVAAVLITVHLIDANIILPKVVGSKVKINALATILAVLTGSALWGIPGMFLFIPFTAILKVVFDATENLKYWGLLLGEDNHVPARRRRAFRKWRKPVHTGQS